MSQPNISAISDSGKYLEFEVANKLFAYHIRNVAEIMEYPEIESLPLSPDFVLGAINLRGSVIPIVDLAVCLGLPIQPVTAKSCVIISDVEYQGVVYQVGNKVDLVTRVIDISSAQIEKAPDLAGQLEHRVLIGVAKLDTRLLTILNVDKLLTEAQLHWLEKAELNKPITNEDELRVSHE
ncbi:purine-binding chemotaxis protein CheW [Vibrio sp. T187]|uniref:chemotaxis protein CheW n=1 Tax=Vibrio TaxID=662 RepID=UPI0010C9AAC7|nr:MULTISPECIES: chemotaxis protein CheW [Vibrio]MBW3694741.1 purine-binding chemotaxis protein CheW [Vibrio sp. T187]